MSVINTNVNSLIGLTNLYKTNKGVSSTLEKLSSGYRINKAADDPSGLAIASTMTAQIGGIRMAIQNAEDGVNMIQTADGALAETDAILQRMRDLAVRASNDAVLTTDDLDRLNDEFIALKSEIDRKATAVTFNTKQIMNGSINADPLQIGPDNGHKLDVTISQVNTTRLAINNATISTIAHANSSISAVNAAIENVAGKRSSLGVVQRRLGHVINDLMATDVNLTAARSRIMDADMAKEISEFTKLQILQQAGTAILAQSNAQPQSVLQLLG
jgi:flagellin